MRISQALLYIIRKNGGSLSEFDLNGWIRELKNKGFITVEVGRDKKNEVEPVFKLTPAGTQYIKDIPED